MAEQQYCIKCGRTMGVIEFYKSRRLDKYPPNGVMNICKKCLTLHVDNWDKSTFLPILEEINVPYIKDEWDKVLLNYGQDPTKVTGTSILGRYLAKMKLKQYKDYTFADSERLEQELREKKAGSLRSQGLSEDEISAELSTDHGPAKPDIPIDSSTLVEEEPDEYEDQLTEEDKAYLRLKWGKAYRPSEWVYMEKFYREMTDSYDIQTAGHRDTLIMLCKTSLKANQLLDACDRQTMST